MHRPIIVQLYHLLDTLSEGVVFGLIIMAPWAFGCAPSNYLTSWTVLGVAQPWTIWVLDIGGYILATLLLCKLAFRASGYRPGRWPDVSRAENRTGALLQWTVGSLTFLIIAYCLVNFVNARSLYHSDQFNFEYFKFIDWLPHSSDRRSSELFFLNHLAMAGCFWGVFDWLNGQPARNEPAQLSRRLQRLLWVLSVNGGLIAVEGILQRLSGTNRILWLATPNINASPEFQFGPYAYRANAAQFFNLLWPVTVGFWWTLQHAAGRYTNRHHLLLVCAGLMAASSIMSNSRAGAIIAVVALFVAGGILAFSLRHSQGELKLGIFLVLLAVVGLGLMFAGKKFTHRLGEMGTGLSQREQIYTAAADMAREHKLYGTGPGTFEVLFQFYRTSTDDYWPAQLHNDWLETLITFGWVGSALIGLALLAVLIRWFQPGGITCDWTFVSLIWLGLVTCLLHARFDFPLQIMSIELLFLTLCVVLLSVSRTEPAKP